MDFVNSNNLNLQAEEDSLSFLNGYFLRKVILKKKKTWQECFKAFISDLDDDQTVNSLITTGIQRRSLNQALKVEQSNIQTC